LLYGFSWLCRLYKITHTGYREIVYFEHGKSMFSARCGAGGNAQRKREPHTLTVGVGCVVCLTTSPRGLATPTLVRKTSLCTSFDVEKSKSTHTVFFFGAGCWVSPRTLFELGNCKFCIVKTDVHKQINFHQFTWKAGDRSKRHAETL